MTVLPDMVEADFVRAYNRCEPFTMTSAERLYALYQAVRYIVSAGVEGDFVECGVWKGGSVMMIAETLKSMGIFNRNIYLFDTFEGMTAPSEHDRDYSDEMRRPPSTGTPIKLPYAFKMQKEVDP